MANIILPPEWQLKEKLVTPKSVYVNRRAFTKQLGLGTIALLTPLHTMACSPDRSGHVEGTGQGPDGPLDTIPANAPRTGYPAERNPAFEVSERGSYGPNQSLFLYQLL